MRPVPGNSKRHGIAQQVRDTLLRLPQPFTLRQLASVTGHSVATVNGPVQRLVVEGVLDRHAVPGRKATSYSLKEMVHTGQPVVISTDVYATD